MKQTRREWLGRTASAASGAYPAGSCVARATPAPSSPVAVSRCKTYEPGELLPAVATAVMGFDPMADRGTPPFERCDSTLRLAEDVGLGTRDLKRIEVLGTRIQDARFDFAAIRKQRRRLPQPEFGLRG